MTTTHKGENEEPCRARTLLKMLAGKWKPEIFRLAAIAPLRFNTLLKQIKGSNKQSLALALKELEETGLLEKVVIKQKPLHIEYNLTPKGKTLIPILEQLEELIG